jgi:PTH1 family peptidyl-tRNA hydrolase
MQLIVGLGNPTCRYVNTRHNIGFRVVDKIVDHFKASNISKKEFKGELFRSSNTLLLKPQTYMNLSGESVFFVCRYYKIDINSVVVVHDDLDLEFGRIKVKYAGGSGGHNGLKSIDNHLSNSYKRVRVGIGRPSANQGVSDYVLDNFNEKQIESLQGIVALSAKVSLELLTNSVEDMQKNYLFKQSIF